MNLNKTDTFNLYGEIYCVTDIVGPSSCGTLEGLYVIESCTGNPVAMSVEISQLDAALNGTTTIEEGTPLTITAIRQH
jgi:hypothetical protein